MFIAVLLFHLYTGNYNDWKEYMMNLRRKSHDVCLEFFKVLEALTTKFQ